MSGSRKYILLFLFLSACCRDHYFEDRIVHEFGSFTRIPVRFSKLSLMDVEIEGRKYSVEIDTGSGCDLALYNDVLNNVCFKRFSHEGEYYDINGDVYLNDNFIINNVNIRDLVVDNVIVQEESKKFRIATEIDFSDVVGNKEASEVLFTSDGRIGNGIFRSYFCIFDFPHSAIYLANDLSERQIKDLFKDFIKVPFQVDDSGLIVITVEVDFGKIRLALDTGSSLSILKKSCLAQCIQVCPPPLPPPGKNMLIIKNKKLVIGAHNFGKKKFCIYEFPDVLDTIDGVLGLEFFQEHTVGFDFKRNLLLISR